MSKNLQFLVILLLIPFFTQALDAAPLKTLSLDFTRELTEKDKTEIIAGTLHYDVKVARVVVEVTKPVKQIMIVKGKVLEIYYPVEKQAFRFISEGRVPLPFVESIIQTTQAEYGLTAIGYTLDKHDVVEKVLYTYWKPPEKTKDSLGVVILGMRDDRLISAEVKDPEGYIIGRSRYQNHSKIGINYIPMEVTSSTYDAKSEVLQQEKIVYSSPQVNVETPNPILNFTIPESVEVKEIKW
ncbi:hypothetical protein F4X90_11670 [Candidatus Poribacteria bacterium]|nr:hypothetical protein [Candidatus Poribacteria bacterium]